MPESAARAAKAHGQPVGEPVPNWSPRPLPQAQTLTGTWCRLERLDPTRHAAQLFSADRTNPDSTGWTYLPYGPFEDLDSYTAWSIEMAASADPYFFAIIDTETGSVTEGSAIGVLSLLRVTPAAGTIEVGHIHYSARLQRRRAATEAQYLLLRYVFDDLGYRRYEWKCDALNAPSRRAAERLGFTFEGVFRHAVVVKGRNRDTAWYAIIDDDWPALRESYRSWLAPENFDLDGHQVTRLRADRPL